MKQYYMLAQNDDSVDITIYGDITSWPWFDGDMSAYLLSKQIEGIEAGTINVYINSYGGEVAEGLAIYNALKRHTARVRTYCDGFACSAASVIFMAGEERIMGEASLLMIHNAWSYAGGNAKELRKAAEDLDTISAAAANAYKASVNISDEKLAELLDNETWILPEDAVAMGFATSVEGEQKSSVPAASAKMAMFSRMTAKRQPAPAQATTIEVKISDLPELQQLADQIKALMDAEKPKEPTNAENKTIKFLNALMTGRKD